MSMLKIGSQVRVGNRSGQFLQFANYAKDAAGKAYPRAGIVMLAKTAVLAPLSEIIPDDGAQAQNSGVPEGEGTGKMTQIGLRPELAEV